MRGAGARAGPVAVTVPVTTTAAARQAELPARLFPGNRLSSRASVRGSRGGAVAFEHGVTCRVRRRSQRYRGTRSRSTDFAVPAGVPIRLPPSHCPALSRRRPREAAVRVHWLMRPLPGSDWRGVSSVRRSASAALKARVGAAGEGAGKGGAVGR